MGESIFDGLNAAQRAAVETLHGPVVILAGAGTGKTTTITRRIANQVAAGAFAPDRILAVTFTQKAAREMGARLGALGVGGVRAQTFHAEALAQYRRFSPDQPDILSHKAKILSAIAQRLPGQYRFTAVRDLASEIEWAKNRRLGERDYLGGLDGHEPPIPADLMHRVYVNYELRKRRAGLIDFEDLLERAVEHLQDDARALGILRARYRAFTVDEYQDVNLLQQSLLDLWVGDREDVCVVGDDYQSIFGFTGASPSYLLRFAGRFERPSVFTLEENHRSTPEILSLANRLVPNLGGSRKTLRAVRPPGPAPRLSGFDSGAREVSAIVDEIRRLHDAEGIPWEEIAVLYRINGRSEDFEDALGRASIPYQVRDGSFLQRPAARGFVAKAKRSSEPVVATAERILGELGYDPRAEPEAAEEQTRQSDLGRLLALAREFAAAEPGRPADAFVDDLRARFAVEDSGRGAQLMTFHRAKGLEFEAVFLPRLEDKELPFALAKGAEELAEERRLLYVGITRAKRWLWISYARSREGERRAKPRPSPFLDELRPEEPRQPAPPGGLPAKAKRRAGGPLFDALRAWRLEVAKRQGLPAYVVFADATLAEIAEARPSTRAALRAISGVGPLKMQRYGEQILAILSNLPPDPDAVGAAG